MDTRSAWLEVEAKPSAKELALGLGLALAPSPAAPADAPKQQHEEHQVCNQNDPSWTCPSPRIKKKEAGDEEALATELRGIVFDTAYEANVDLAIQDLGVHEALIGLYWYCVDHHEGQTSDEYRILSALSQIFSPGPMQTGPDDEYARMAYDLYAGSQHDPGAEHQEPEDKHEDVGPNEDPHEASMWSSAGSTFVEELSMAAYGLPVEQITWEQLHALQQALKDSISPSTHEEGAAGGTDYDDHVVDSPGTDNPSGAGSGSGSNTRDPQNGDPTRSW